MSLNWNVAKIDDFKHRCYQTMTPEDAPEGKTLDDLIAETRYSTCPWGRPDDGEDVIRRMAPVTSVLIMLTMVIKMGEITAENAAEFYARVACWEKAHGAHLYNADGTDRYITYEDVKSHIGLGANVITEGWEEYALHLAGQMRTDVLGKIPTSERIYVEDKLSTVLDRARRNIEKARGMMADLNSDLADQDVHCDATNQFSRDYEKLQRAEGSLTDMKWVWEDAEEKLDDSYDAAEE